jgi:DNA-binding MarR family transcriptional regulator
MNGAQGPIATTGGRWAKLAARAVADRSLTATHVRILAVIGIYADRDGVAWPSQDTIATVIGINRATVCRAIKRLREHGYLDRYRKPTNRGRYRNVYQLFYPPYVPPRAEIATTEIVMPQSHAM